MKSDVTLIIFNQSKYIRHLLSDQRYILSHITEQVLYFDVSEGFHEQVMFAIISSSQFVILYLYFIHFYQNIKDYANFDMEDYVNVSREYFVNFSV